MVAATTLLGVTSGAPSSSTNTRSTVGAAQAVEATTPERARAHAAGRMTCVLRETARTMPITIALVQAAMTAPRAVVGASPRIGPTECPNRPRGAIGPTKPPSVARIFCQSNTVPGRRAASRTMGGAVSSADASSGSNTVSRFVRSMWPSPADLGATAARRSAEWNESFTDPASTAHRPARTARMVILEPLAARTGGRISGRSGSRCCSSRTTVHCRQRALADRQSARC